MLANNFFWSQRITDLKRTLSSPYDKLGTGGCRTSRAFDVSVDDKRYKGQSYEREISSALASISSIAFWIVLLVPFFFDRLSAVSRDMWPTA